MTDPRVLLAHLARALSRYAPEAERVARLNGGHAPPELLVLAEFLADLATVRHDEPPDAAGFDLDDSGGMPSPLLTKSEAAASLRCSSRTIDRLVASGDLPAVTMRGATRIRRADLEDYVADLAGSRSFRETVTAKSPA